MPKGRPPKPQKLNSLRGDPGKRRRNQVEPEPPHGWPEMPEHIAADPVAAAEWESVCEHLDSMSLLSTADRTAIELYCATYSRYRDADEKAKKYGDIHAVGPNKVLQVSPFYTVRNRYLEDCRKMLIEFGLTPSARSRLAINAKDKTDKSWTDLMRVV